MTSLIPPHPHACLYSLDLFVNEAFMTALDKNDVPLGQDTDFDWMMHTGVMEMGPDFFYG